ncbi:MAG: hypothetical protein QOJ65_604, partial [Fimbriimonadaceae bacterium]|nr:hypothetical protein [Fimbriimonadaceae bacterium]
MARKPRLLKHLRVASPCPVKWSEMRGDDRIRHCAICSLNVYNVSAMTESEAEDLLASASGRLCVQFYRRADGTVLTQDCPVGLAAMKRKLAANAAAAAAFVFA